MKLILFICSILCCATSATTAPLSLILLGKPGAGKGVQSAKLTKHYQLVHLSTGHLLREEVDQKTTLGQSVSVYLQQGKLVPDTLVLQILRQHMLAAQRTGCRGFVFDGFPRTTKQAKALHTLLQQLGLPAPIVLQLHITDSCAKSRLKQRKKLEHRSDDVPKIVAHRLKVYHQHIPVLLAYYRAQSTCCLIRLDGSHTPHQVMHCAIKQIDRHRLETSSKPDEMAHKRHQDQ